jgi:hypothetical protein
MDFEQTSNFPESSLISVALPAANPANYRPVTINTNVMGVPVSVSWDGTWVDVSMTTNRPDLALTFVDATDAQGEHGKSGAGSWNQFSFRKGGFMARLPDGRYNMDFKPASVTLAVVPNIHTTFYVQPKLIPEENLQPLAASTNSGSVNLIDAPAKNALELYQTCSKLKLEIAPDVNLRAGITLHTDQTNQAEVAKLLEQALLKQAGIVITKHGDTAIATYNGAPIAHIVPVHPQPIPPPPK